MAQGKKVPGQSVDPPVVLVNSGAADPAIFVSGDSDKIDKPPCSAQSSFPNRAIHAERCNRIGGTLNDYLIAGCAYVVLPVPLL